MHYYKDPQNREKKLTRDFVEIHLGTLYEILDLRVGDLVVVELQKFRYGKDGDVDIAVWKNPGTELEVLIGVEVKVIFLDEDGEFKSEKLKKHNKQIRALEKEGWDYVYFFDFIITKPSVGWLHPQGLDGFKKYRKTVDSSISGHVVFGITSVTHKPESMAGGIGSEILKEAVLNPNKLGKAKLIKAFNQLNFSRSSVIVDPV